MLDMKFIRANPDLIRETLRQKRVEVDLDRILSLDEERRSILSRVEALKARRNSASEQVGRLKKTGQDATAVIEEMRLVGDEIKALDDRLRGVEEELNYLLLTVPNIPDPDVPVGEDESGNIEVRRWGAPRAFDFEPKAHWEIGAALGILDFDRAGKITGARFTVQKGAAARISRALISFMIDLHVTRHGYTEVSPPLMVNRASMTGSGQFPKFQEDVFALTPQEYFLIPTAEVPLVNLHRDEVIKAEDLPLNYVAYTPCFRSEAGAAGRDTRGLIRQHQFDKVEMVKITRPEESNAALDRIVREAEEVLEALGIPYRVLYMCTGDMGFTQAKKFDLEIWMPSYGRYVEISSASNCGDFQGRRANIRLRNEAGKLEFVHTLNASGVAVGRTLAAILENYQQAGGSVVIPEALRPYLGGVERIG